MGRIKAFWLVLLSLSVAAVLSAGTLAAYQATSEMSATIVAGRMVFEVNGSGSETQSLGAAQIGPGGSASFPIHIDTAGTDVALDVSLSVTASGSALPPGLEVMVDGNSVGASGTGTYTATYPGMNGTERSVPVVVSWNATSEQLKSAYDGSRTFSLSLSATVTASQVS